MHLIIKVTSSLSVYNRSRLTWTYHHRTGLSCIRKSALSMHSRIVLFCLKLVVAICEPTRKFKTAGRRVEPNCDT